jgi:hypothetical protein
MGSLKQRPLQTGLALIAILVLVHILLIRPWYMHWGATVVDQRLPLPGDRLITRTATISTRALRIDAPAPEVWRWLVQLGQGRGGFYSHDWLENLFAAEMYNADSIRPELQILKVGDRLSLQQDGPTIEVSYIDPERTLVLGGGWIFALIPVDSSTTRLIVRYPYDWSGSFIEMLYYYSILEPAHFVMESGMMLGIKDRAERSFHDRERKRTQTERISHVGE